MTATLGPRAGVLGGFFNGPGQPPTPSGITGIKKGIPALSTPAPSTAPPPRTPVATNETQNPRPVETSGASPIPYGVQPASGPSPWLLAAGAAGAFAAIALLGRTRRR